VSAKASVTGAENRTSASAPEGVDASAPSDADALGAPVANDEPPAGAGVLGHLRLETRGATIAYWVAIALVSLSVLVPRLFPGVDYPQHLGLADVARRLIDPHAPEHASHWVNYFTYNGLFHILVAQLGRLMPVELAGRLVVSGSLAMLGGASLALLRALGRPPSHAALFVPAIFSFSLGWGFVNFTLGTALAVTCAALIARALARPRLSTWIATAVVGLLCAATHVLAMLLLCLLAASMAPEVGWRHVGRPHEGRRDRAVRTVLRAVVALSPLLLGAAWCIAVYKVQYEWDPVVYKDATLEGTSPPLWQKLAFFGAFTTGLHSDRTDQVLLGAALAVLAVGTALAFKSRRDATAEPTGGKPVVLPFAALFGAYATTPMVFIGTHLIFPRLGQLVVLTAAIAAPAFPARLRPRARRISLAIAALTGVSLLVHMVLFARETNDASRVIDDAPEGRRATAVVYSPETFSFRNGPLVHLAAYYGARKHGDWAFSFARYLSVPVRFRSGEGPGWPKIGWEFGPAGYDARCRYARTFDLVFVKAPTDAPDEAAVRRRVFSIDADAVKLLSHHGDYWLFDTKGLPTDGAF
jgi:hypothetical protein